ncbi:flagellar hook protein FlgE [bacterium]|nr:flagellar hook protein FlgE [bacterium]
MISSLYSGASGVQTQSDSMTVTGSNIANVNTTGYKYNRVNFQDLLATSMGGNSKIAKGVKIGNIQNIQTQGAFQVTEMETDVAIDGKGFFSVKDANGQVLYTRAGQFTYDKEGFLTTQEGHYLQVKDVDPDTKETVGDLKNINILNQLDPPTPTGDGVKEGTGVVLKANLDSNSEVPKIAVDYDNVRSEMYNYSTSVTVYDNKGNERNIQIAFRKIPDRPPQVDPATNQPIPNTEIKNNWQWLVLAQGEVLEGGLPGVQKVVGGGFVEFTDDGRLVQNQSGQVAQPQLPPGAPPGTPLPPKTMNRLPLTPGVPNQVEIPFIGTGSLQTIGIAMGLGKNPDDPQDQRTGMDGITQFASDFKVHSVGADGMKSGAIESIYIRDDGIIDGAFDSGKVKSLGRIIIADFKAPEKLQIRGENFYKESYLSGQPIQNDPGTAGLGSIHSKSLENSNVELSTEFVKMIEGQRAFQANAKTVTTSDEILADLIQMKR